MRRVPALLLFCLVILPSVRVGAASGLADPSLMPDFEAKRKSSTPRARPAPPPSVETGTKAEPEARDNPVAPTHGSIRWDEPLPRRPFVVLSSRLWLTSGSADTRYSVQIPPSQINPPTSVYTGETEERGASGLMLVGGAEIAPLEWLSLEVEYGADKVHGRYADRNWIHAPDASTLIYNPTGASWHNPNHEDDLVYGADTAVRRDWASASIYFRLLDSKLSRIENLGLRHSLDFAVGAERYRQYAGLTNLEITSNLMKFYSNAPPGPVPGLNSVYDAVWQGPHFGVREVIEAESGFCFSGLFLYSPAMAYRGLGFNNFAANSGAGRAENPNFVDWAHGSAIHFELSVGWTGSFLRLTAGYQRLSFYARNGLRRYYKGDGTVNDVLLDFAQADLGGAFAGASVRF